MSNSLKILVYDVYHLITSLQSCSMRLNHLAQENEMNKLEQTYKLTRPPHVADHDERVLSGSVPSLRAQGHTLSHPPHHTPSLCPRQESI